MNKAEIFKSFKELDEQIPEFTPQEILEIVHYKPEHVVEIDISGLLEKIIVVLQSLVLEFINSEILHTDAGFQQKDETYALFRYKYEMLKNLHFDNFPPRLLEKIVRKSILISLLFLSGFEQKS